MRRGYFLDFWKFGGNIISYQRSVDLEKKSFEKGVKFIEEYCLCFQKFNANIADSTQINVPGTKSVFLSTKIRKM